MLPRMPDHHVDPVTDPTALADLLAWRDAYRARLLAPTGWWAVTNLAWVGGPSASLGGASDDGLRLPARAPARVVRRAHHPPCAHTPHAMCPLPPLANRLPLAVRAGECWPPGVVNGRGAVGVDGA